MGGVLDVLPFKGAEESLPHIVVRHGVDCAMGGGREYGESEQGGVGKHHVEK
jgi:hypothetical protein